ncbi:hypothetical protein CCACVL1_06388 [Corchorus capsularis]|uniref:Uncharacterized protein n=1 Tax=Corchorus capsularis TaxID=210143 RepID=A0A1R3JFT2_COCAP|nr:hypothetical protein CCACVL1_06388 [Corchorus capsularis]
MALTLKKIIMQPGNGIDASENLRILKEVIRFKRVSPHAEIIYLNPNDDDEMFV